MRSSCGRILNCGHHIVSAGGTTYEGRIPAHWHMDRLCCVYQDTGTWWLLLLLHGRIEWRLRRTRRIRLIGLRWHKTDLCLRCCLWHGLRLRFRQRLFSVRRRLLLFHDQFLFPVLSLYIVTEQSNLSARCLLFY